jgi:oligosaccharyl transferase (archaeosortase A-associated)
MGGEKRNELLEVLAVLIMGLLLRIYMGRNTIQGGNVLFMGYDEFYHMRRVLYTVIHFPNTIWFDSYIDYPHGTNITWPPLFDQLIAGTSLALGQHSQHGIEMVGAIIPLLIGSLAIIVVYIMIKEIFGRNVALMSAFMTALASGFLIKTTLGATDHHSLEVLLLLCSVMFLILALCRPDQRILFAAASGASMAALAYTWAGAAAYFGVVLVYFAVQLTVDLEKNTPPSKEIFVAVLTSLGTALVLTLPFWSKEWMFSSFFGLLAIIAGVILLFGLSKIISDKKFHWAYFPAIAIGLAIAFIITSRLFSGLPIFQRINALVISGGDYILGGGLAGMISEAESLLHRPDYLFYNMLPTGLGWNLLFSVIALGVVISYIWLNRDNLELERGRLLFLVFAIYSLILTIGQIRFLYISSIVMGILISILFFRLSEYIAERSDIKDNRSKFLLPLIFLILIMPTISEDVYFSNIEPPISGDWYGSLKWLEQNTNNTSYFFDPDKVPEYSVMVWWDYGNWVLYESKRPVVSNNFQVGVEDATKFYLAENETAATEILDNRSSKYIITDHNMIFGKIQAIALWAGKNPSDYISVQKAGPYLATAPTKKLAQTILIRLHLLDASTMSHMRLIYESPSGAAFDPAVKQVKVFEYVPGAVIKIITEQNQTAELKLNLTSNQGRSFGYVNRCLPRNNTCEIRVPYSTEKKYDTHAVAPYTITSASSSGIIKRQNIIVSEEDVMRGNTVEARL